MIRFKDKVLEEYFIDPVTAVITDKDGNVQKYNYDKNGRPIFRCMPVHRIQAHTAWGYKKDLSIHHIDGNKLNNALSNLVYLTKSEHCKAHKDVLGRPGMNVPTDIVTLSIPLDLLEVIDTECKRLKLSRSAFCAKAIEYYLMDEENEETDMKK